MELVDKMLAASRRGPAQLISLAKQLRALPGEARVLREIGSLSA